MGVTLVSLGQPGKTRILADKVTQVTLSDAHFHMDIGFVFLVKKRRKREKKEKRTRNRKM